MSFHFHACELKFKDHEHLISTIDNCAKLSYKKSHDFKNEIKLTPCDYMVIAFMLKEYKRLKQNECDHGAYTYYVPSVFL